jgi:hypothetical protein
MRYLVILLFFSTYLHFSAQELLSSAGENGQNSSGSMTYSLGELISETGSEGNQYLTQGYCQPPPEMTNLAEAFLSQMTISPNPFSNQLNFRGNITLQSIQFSLCSIDGQEVFRSEEVKALPYQWILPQLAEGSYLLCVHSSNEFNLIVSHLIHIAQ